MVKEEILKRIWMISDIHLGVRSNSSEWLEIHKKYFYDFLIPLLKIKKKAGDVLFVLGDIFESRQTINILVLNESLKIFKMLSELMPVYILIGNHDCYKKFATDVNSPVIFNFLENVKVISNVEVLQANFGKKLLMMPWQENSAAELDVVKNNDADYMFCHTHFKNTRFNRRTVMEDGLDIDEVAKFKKVYSGHIHYSQTQQNVRMIGCIFQLTRSDIGNRKQIVMLDLESGKEEIFENDFSPKFLKFKIEDILNLTHETFQDLIQNNFVDIIVEGEWIAKFPYSQFIDSLTGYMKLNYVLSTLQKDYENEDAIDENINIEELTKIYIESLGQSESIKNSLLEATNRLMRKATKYMEEKVQESES